MEKTLKILMIGSDKKLFEDEERSAVSERIKEYGLLVEELHIIVFATEKYLQSLKIKNSKLKIADNVWVYPTGSLSKWFYVHDAARLGKKIVFDRKFVRGQSIITTQDPFECGWAGLKVKSKWRLPLEVQLHTNPFSPYFNGFQNWVRKLFIRKILRNADTIRVVTEDLKTRMSRLTKVQIKVLPIYVDKKKIEDGHVAFDLHARYGWRFGKSVV